VKREWELRLGIVLCAVCCDQVYTHQAKWLLDSAPPEAKSSTVQVAVQATRLLSQLMDYCMLATPAQEAFIWKTIRCNDVLFCKDLAAM
jgi:hypothetical protein